MNEWTFIYFDKTDIETFKCWFWSNMSFEKWTDFLFIDSTMMCSEELINVFFDASTNLSSFLFLMNEEFKSHVLIVNSYELKNSKLFEDEASRIDEDFEFAF